MREISHRLRYSAQREKFARPTTTMKLALIIISIITVISVALFYFTADRSLGVAVDMPWQVRVIDPQHSEVFGVVLNQTTLEQARQKFGQVDGIALFRNSDGQFSLEAYFGKVHFGHFSARLIANLDASQQEMEKLTAFSIKRVPKEDGSIRWTLNSDKQAEQATRRIRALSYIPDYKGMDEQYLIERFGEPARRETVDNTSERWFYPQRGIRILLDSKGKELFEYMPPAQFTLPQEAQ